MIYTVANQKGGVAKTSTAAAIVSGAKRYGLRALAIDFDPQRSLTWHFSADAQRPGAVNLATSRCEAQALVQHTDSGDIIPCCLEFATIKSDVKALKANLKALQQSYDLIVIDTPPSLSLALVAALKVADGVIIPVAPEVSSLEGISDLLTTIKAAGNPPVTGILVTMLQTRSAGAMARLEAIRTGYTAQGLRVFNAVIRRGVAIADADDARESVFQYAPKSNPAQDYDAFLRELLQDVITQ